MSVTPSCLPRRGASADANACACSEETVRGADPLEKTTDFAGRPGNGPPPGGNGRGTEDTPLAPNQRVLFTIQGSYGDQKTAEKFNPIHFAEAAERAWSEYQLPKVMEAICAGQHSVTISAERLKDHARLPIEWDAQQRLLAD